MNAGSSFFTMPDVNLLFVSPVSPKKVMVYGLLKQMGATLLIAFFLIAYGGMAVNAFGISVGQAACLLLGFAVVVFFDQMLTILIYSFANGNEKRIRGVKTVVYALLAALLCYLAVRITAGGTSLESVYAAVSDPVLEFLPVVGWMKGLLFGAMAGDLLRALLFGGLMLAGLAACIWLFWRSDADYYEDVLQTTESAYQLKAAIKEGRVVDKSTLSGKTPKVRETGLRGGWGASAFFYKQFREIKRTSRLVFLGKSTLTVLAAGLFMAIVMKNVGGDGEPMPPNIVMVSVLAMCVYMLFFFNAAGEWSKELMKPYLFLVPEPPFQKLLWASMTSVLRPALEGVIVFAVVWAVIGCSPLTAVMCMLSYASFGFLFTASNLLSERLLGQMANKGLILVLYLLMLLVIIAPGLAAAILLKVYLPAMPGALMALPLAMWNVLVSLGIYAVCRNTLHDMELR